MDETRLGIVGIVVEDLEASTRINAILHDYANIIVGRFGIPYRARGVAVIGVVVDGLMDSVSAMTGKLGKVPGVSVKASLTKVSHPDSES